MYKIKLTTSDFTYYYGQEDEGYLTKEEPTGYDTYIKAEEKVAELTKKFNFDPPVIDEETGEEKYGFKFEIEKT